MVRGHAKVQAQAAAQKRAAAQQGGKSQLGKVREQGLKFTCPVCKISSPVRGGSWKFLTTVVQSPLVAL